MGYLLSSRAGMGLTPDQSTPAVPVPISISAPRTQPRPRPPPPCSVPSLAEYARARLADSPRADGVQATILTRQERRDLLLAQMAWHDEQFSRQFGPQFLRHGHPAHPAHPAQFQQQRLSGLPGVPAAAGQPMVVPPAVQPAHPATVGRSAESTACSRVARFVVDNQESIAAKCKHGFGRLPRVATVDLAAVPDTEISHVTVSASTYVSAPAPKAGRSAKKETKPKSERETKGLRPSSPLSVSSASSAASAASSPSRSSVPRTLRGSPRRVTKRPHKRASSALSASSASASSLDAITSYIASMPESKTLPRAHSGFPGRPKARHVSFHVNEYGRQGFTIRGNGTEQSYEICGEAMLFGAASSSSEPASRHDNNDKGRWESLIYGLGPRTREKRESADALDACARPTLPSLMEVAALQADSRQRASLDLPPMRKAGPATHATSVLATMQPRPAQPALSMNSSLSATLAKMAESPMSEEEAVMEEHIRALEAAIRAGGAKRRVVEGEATNPWETVVLIPPETAASVGSLLGVILREQYCKLRRAAETQQEQAAEAAEAAEVAEAPETAEAAAQGVSLPSIAEMFGPKHLSYGQHALPPYQRLEKRI